MKTLSIFITFLIFLSCSENKPSYNPLSFELRLAESEPDPNLIEMNLKNSNLKFFVQETVFLNNEDIESADVFDLETHPKVMVILTDNGREKFAAFTSENIGKNAAILVDQKLVSAPKIMAGITEGKLIIIGHFSQEEVLKISEGITP